MAWEHFDLPYHDGWSVSCALFTEVSDTKRLLDEARSGALSNCCLLNAKRIMSPMQVGEMQLRVAFRDYFSSSFFADLGRSQPGPQPPSIRQHDNAQLVHRTAALSVALPPDQQGHRGYGRGEGFPGDPGCPTSCAIITRRLEGRGTKDGRYSCGTGFGSDRAVRYGRIVPHLRH